MAILFLIAGFSAFVMLAVMTPWLLWRMLRGTVATARWIGVNFMAGWREAAAEKATR